MPANTGFVCIFLNMPSVQVCGGDSHTWTYNRDYLSSLSLSLSPNRLPAGLDYFPSSNGRIMPACLRKWFWQTVWRRMTIRHTDTKRHTETHTHRHRHTHRHTQRCMHIRDASLDSVTLYSGAGFDDLCICQTKAEINLRVKRVGR